MVNKKASSFYDRLTGGRSPSQLQAQPDEQDKLNSTSNQFDTKSNSNQNQNSKTNSTQLTSDPTADGTFGHSASFSSPTSSRSHHQPSIEEPESSFNRDSPSYNPHADPSSHFN